MWPQKCPHDNDTMVCSETTLDSSAPPLLPTLCGCGLGGAAHATSGDHFVPSSLQHQEVVSSLPVSPHSLSPVDHSVSIPLRNHTQAYSHPCLQTDHPSSSPCRSCREQRLRQPASCCRPCPTDSSGEEASDCTTDDSESFQGLVKHLNKNWTPSSPTGMSAPRGQGCLSVLFSDVFPALRTVLIT